MSGSTSKRRMPRYPVSSFITGLNKAVGSYYVRDTDIVDANNVELNLGGAVSPRLGIIRYDDSTSDYFSDGRNLQIGHRYSRSDSTKEIMAFAYTGGSRDLYRDNDTGIFSAMSLEPSPSDDNKVRFEQWDDTLYIASQNSSLISYNRGGFGSTSAVDTRDARIDGLYSTIDNDIFSATSGASSGVLKTDRFYYYRFTVDRYHGNEFVGESIPLNYIKLDVESTFDVYYEQVGLQPVSNSINLVASLSGEIPGFFDDAQFLNIYRTPALSATLLLADEEVQDTFYYFLDSISISAGLPSTPTVVYTDDGQIPIDSGKILNYSRFPNPPRSKFIKTHKSRLWFASAQTTVPANPLNKSRIYYSDFLEPESVRFTNFFHIGRGDGEEITGLEDFDAKFLVAFKPNSMWAILGGDNEGIDSNGQFTGVIDIQIVAIDKATGCIAPDSISYGEGGLIWLSNKGVYFFDGTKPKPLRSELIDSILDNLPESRKEFAAGIYTQDRKYILSFTDSTVDPQENQVALEFDFRTNTWTRKTFGNSTVYGVNGYIEAKRGDETGALYALFDTNDSSVGAVQRLGGVQYEIDIVEGVAWSFKTKHFDCGDPDIIKQFKTIIVRLKMTSTVTVDYDIDDGCTTGTLSLTPINCSGGAATATVHTWDETGLNWLGSAGQDLTHVWASLGENGGFGAQQTYVINIATAATPNPKGRRIQFEFSGTATIQGQEFQGLTITFVPEERIGNA